MRNVKLYKWSLVLMVFVASTASAQIFPRNNDVFGSRTNKPVVRQDGSRQWPDGTIQYPNGTTRYPDGAVRYPDGRMTYPRNQGNNNWGNNHDNCNHKMPPGQAKKRHGGHAKDYAKGKKNCNHGRGDRDRDDDDDRNVRRYPQQYPQYPSYPQQNPRGSQQGGKRPSRTTNPNM